MILTLAWKEYREHRSVWFTMVLLAGMLAFAVARFSAPGSADIASRVALAVLGLAAAYGVVCGAMMLAGEHETGTLVFLDIFSGRRGLLWLWKCLVGVALALSEALAVALALYLLQEGPPGWLAALLGQGDVTALGWRAGGVTRAPAHLWFWVLPLVTLEAYAWGLLGSALARRVLAGAGVAILIAAPCWLVAVLLPPPAALVLRLAAALAALVVSLNLFQGQSRDTPLGPPPRSDEEGHRLKRVLAEWDGRMDELERRAPQLAGGDGAVVETLEVVGEVRAEPKSALRGRRRPPQARSPGHVLLWLTFRQALFLFGFLAGAAALVGLAIPAHGQVLWPVATLLLGVACGTATFTQEQSDLSYQFLAAQHFPLKTVWNVKILFWFAVAVLASLLLLWGGALTVLANLLAPRRAALLDPADPRPNGFAFGTLRELMGSALFFGAWLVYGFCAGQVCVLLCRRGVLAVLLAGGVALTALGLWLPSVLCLGLGGWQLWVPPLLALAATRSLVRAWAGGRVKERKPLAALAGFSLAAVAWVAVVLGFRAWEIPDREEPVDRLAFRASIPAGQDNLAGRKIQEAAAAIDHPDAWLVPLREVARLPVGVIEGPRGDGQPQTLAHLPACRKLVVLLRTGARDVLERGVPAVAVEELAILLALSRNLRNKVPLTSYLAGVDAEAAALHELEAWLRQGKPAPDLLRRALDELNRHAAETPPPLDCLRTECFRAGGLLNNPIAWGFHASELPAERVPEPWLADGIALALDTPWESERKTRLWRAVWEGLFRAVRTPYWKLPADPGEVEGEREATRLILRGWLPEAGASLTRARLARWLDESWLSDVRLFAPVVPLRAAATRARWRVDAGRLAVALGLYQLREGKAARRLEELVPKYLPQLPPDPYSGRPFGYRLSKGEPLEVQGANGLERVAVPVGQGLLWSTGPDRVDHGGHKHGGEVPEDDARWSRGDLDLVTLVPRWD